MRESALVVYRAELISVTRGNPASVEFDFDRIWKFRKNLGKEFDPAFLHWVHVHPSGFGTRPSSVDQNCAAGLHAAFGSLENFGILCFSDASFDNVSGFISWYRWENGLKLLREDPFQDNCFLEEHELSMLKALSYGELWQPKSESTVSEPLVQTSSSN